MPSLLSISSRTQKRSVILVGLAGILLLIVAASLTMGAFPISLPKVFQFLVGIQWGDASLTLQERNVLLQIRLPRIVMAMLVGGSLAMAGAALQGLFRNPLVEPGLIGVSSGSALFAVVYIVFGSSVAWLAWMGKVGLALFAFVGGLMNTALVYKLSSKAGKTDISLLILAGVALNALAGALIGLAIFYADDAALRNFTFWSLGDVGGANWEKVLIMSLVSVIPVGLILGQFQALNALAIGESEAFHMGINVQQTKLIVLIGSALIVGTAVAFTGTIGFVGLVVPHLLRILIGADHRLVLPAAWLAGAILLTVADTLARTMVAPSEMPIGIITAIIGAPFFIWLLSSIKQIRY
ncbi:FecCD family ABC transporter permease [Mongoliitalea daihaiensis]|uniref:FecCD family ABC transporter permease n=1 Tax=Mongoliitalea daihaiensis TaxID=2782006 RepID=UPI001F31355C|nr:iron ABC transporter permease [Mongoliitalea daihaiensis]UJP65650.1 iron ABC transporter permease [Mongoliitalea daihaiensis]